MYKWHKHENLQLIHKDDLDSMNYWFILFILFQPAAYFFMIYFYSKLKNLWIKKLNVEEKPIIKPKVKYEDKYIDEYRKIELLVLSADKLDSLKHTFLIENTPFGNLMMHYDHSRESFIYYSDNTIPYRFLEVASRRYVIQNNCKSIHISMEHELTEAEKKLQEKKEKEKEKEKDKNCENKEPVKKNVFAKLKNYNTSSVRAPNDVKSKANSNSNNRSAPTANPKTEENTNIIVKEKANRYSYEGKFANFAFLQKVNKKAIDTRYQMSFSDFKKMTLKQN